MRLVRFGGAMSLDGYIAGPNGEHDWMVMDPEIDFAGVMRQFDTFLIGRKTFDVMKGMGNAGKSPRRWPGRSHRHVGDPGTAWYRDPGVASAGARDAQAAITSRLQNDRNHRSGVRHREKLARVAEATA